MTGVRHPAWLWPPGGTPWTWPPYPSVPIANTPAKILGSLLHADFDAADSGIVLNGTNVASIPNRGNDTAPMVQAAPQAQPAFSATSFANGPGLTFDGLNDTMLCTFNTPIPAGRRPYMWVIYRANNATLSFQVVGDVYSADGVTYLLVWQSRADATKFTAQIALAGGTVETTYDGNTETANTHLTETGYTIGGIAAVVFDGVASNISGTIAQPIPQPLTAMRMSGYATVLNYPASCTIRRIIVANDLPSAAQISAMRAYLRAQPYGLTF